MASRMIGAKMPGGSTAHLDTPKRPKLEAKHQRRLVTVHNADKEYQLGPGASRMQSSDDVTGPVFFQSNLWNPDEKLVYEAHRFEVEKVMSTLKRGAFQMPLNVNIELTGQVNTVQQKHLSVKFNLDTAADDELRSPSCKISYAIRKGYNLGKNPTMLTFNHEIFTSLVQTMREFFHTAKGLVESNQTYDSLSAAGLPIYKIMKETINADQTSTLLVVSLKAISVQSRDRVTPIISIQEYYDDRSNNCFQPSMKGVSMALNAAFMLMYPTARAISIIQESLTAVKTSFDKHETFIKEKLLGLENDSDSTLSETGELLNRYCAEIVDQEDGVIAVSEPDHDQELEIDIDVNE